MANETKEEEKIQIFLTKMLQQGYNPMKVKEEDKGKKHLVGNLFPTQDIEKILNDGINQGWFVELEPSEVVGLDKQKEKELFDKLESLFNEKLIVYANRQYALKSEAVTHSKKALEEKLENYKKLKEDESAWLSIPEPQRNAISQQGEEIEEEIDKLQYILDNLSLAELHEEKEPITKKEPVNEPQEAVDAIDEEILKEGEKPVLCLDLLEKIENKLNRLIDKLDSLIQQIDDMIDYEHGKDIREVETVDKNNDETEEIEKALDEAGIDIEEIEAVDGDKEAIEVVSKEEVKNEVEVAELEKMAEDRKNEIEELDAHNTADKENGIDIAEDINNGEAVDLGGMEDYLSEEAPEEETPKEKKKQKSTVRKKL